MKNIALDLLGALDTDSAVDTGASALKGLISAFTKKDEPNTPEQPKHPEPKPDAKKAEEPGFLSTTIVGPVKVWHGLALVAVAGGGGAVLLRRRGAST